MGDWLMETFGGDITLLAEHNPDGEPNPDYFWNGKLWDLKTPTTANAVSKRLRHGLHQILPNPGGVILDVGNTDMSIEEIERIVNNRMRASCKEDVDIILYQNGEVKRVLRYKK